KDVLKHFLRCFATMGVPQKVKTDNGPAYVSKHFLLFLQTLGIDHITSIPRSSTGQAVMERAHHS
ncbi:POK10 protein, partial [Chordeiles acutipennis]|nr:POK10 protein [Chordeiles acutipennis]